MDLGIRGKIALVTGAGQGIGRATALALAAEGASVCVCDVNEEECRQTAKDIEALGVSALSVKADISRRRTSRTCSPSPPRSSARWIFSSTMRASLQGAL